jgi:glycosyltransferase involved in cell wall biosynthesis
MRVLHVMVYDGPGGYCRVIYDLCRRARRWTPLVCSLGAGPWTARIRELGIPVTDLGHLLADPDRDRAAAELQRLADGIDVINVHLGPVYPPPVQGFVSLFSAPVVFTLHWAWRLPVRNSTIICTSKPLPALQRTSNRCVVIENGIDIEQYHPAARRDRRVIIRVCRPERTAMYFWDAALPVLARHPDVELWIVGEDGPSHGQVRYLGHRDDVPELMRQATVLSYAPRPREGSLDLVVLEAMASGTVPITTRVQATGVIRHGRDGLLVPYGDILALERALDRALSAPARLRRLARNARATVERRFDLERVVARYEDVYAQLVR